jgi:preprotein translocase subunit SecA
VLVGTRSVAASEALGKVLDERGVAHVVLNARQNSTEAAIVAAAGDAGRVTVATNMAGRGTDIRLGDGVTARGGLYVILTEYHESGRVDRQLFGRCARQGDPGSYEAVVSMEDDLFVRHAGGLAAMLSAAGADPGSAMPAWKAVLLKAAAQRAAEAANSYARRITLEQDRKLGSALAFVGAME